MTQEDKELLLKDLCGRLPYGIIASVRGSDEEFQHFHILGVKYGKVLVENNILQVNDFEDAEVVKPYLRPMSSMTEEEREEYTSITHSQNWLIIGEADKYVDWLNAHHFDYRCLIEKGLAFEVTEENNPYK